MDVAHHFIFEQFVACGVKNCDHVINLDSFIQHGCHQGLSVCSPFNSNSAVRFGLSKLLQASVSLFHVIDRFLADVPEVHFSGAISKASNHGNLRKWIDSYSVSEALSKLEQGLAIFVVQSSCSRLHT